MSGAPPAAFSGKDLELELLDANSEPLVRLFRHTGGDWTPPEEKYRNLRVDPPAGFKADYSVLYTGNTLPTVSIECRVLTSNPAEEYKWARDLAEEYNVVRYTFDKPAVFIPIDGHRNRHALGLAGKQRRFAGYEPYQTVAHELFRRYGEVVHGLSWESFHRNQPGRVYAIWHHHKSTVGLKIESPTPYVKRAQDPEWLGFLRDNPDIEEIISPGHPSAL